MRKIKFRAWDKNKKRYSRQDEQSFLVENNENESYNVASVSFGCELEQFTGVYDEVGNEIYEGDIVMVYPYKLEEISFFGLVEYKESFGFRVHVNDEFIGTTDLSLTVVGNIHENKEILDEFTRTRRY